MIADLPFLTQPHKFPNESYTKKTFSNEKAKNLQNDFLIRIETEKIQVVSNHEVFVYYHLKDLINIIIPNEMSYLINSYRKSEYILQLNDDWDDNGGKAYSHITWVKVITFINDYATKIYKDFNKKITSPKIYHGPKQSIDILLENDKYSLLINIGHESDLAVYFGKDIYDNSIKGEFNITKTNYSLIPVAFNF